MQCAGAWRSNDEADGDGSGLVREDERPLPTQWCVLYVEWTVNTWDRYTFPVFLYRFFNLQWCPCGDIQETQCVSG